MRAARWAVSGFLLLAAILAFVAMPAQAEVTGPCTGTINGQAIRSERITVPENGTVAYSFTAESPPRSWDVRLLYGGITVFTDSDSSDTDDLMATGSANVNQYAWLGVGVYDLVGTVRLDDQRQCKGSVVIVVEGNPLTTLLGGASAVAVVAGTGGAAASSVAAAKAAVAAIKP